MVAPTLLFVVMLVTVLVGSTAAILAWRERPEPGATPLALMLVGQCWWSTFYIFQLEAATLAEKVLWSNVEWVGVVVIPVAWLMFALEYTGKDQYVLTRYIAVLSVIPAITVVLAMTGRYQDLFFVDARLVTSRGLVVLEQDPGPWYWVIAGYTYLLGLLGTIPLLRLVRSDAANFRLQSLAILVGTLVPWASNALFLLGASPTELVDPTPIAFSISGVAYLGALTRFRLFGTSPAPTRNARRLVFERMHDGAIVVDSHDYVVDMNENAADILGVEPKSALGSPAAEILPQYDHLPEDGQAPEHLTIRDGTGSRFYDVTVTRIGDFHERTIGRIITLHDVGDHLRQQQRLEVLNRVLRHNIRTETTIISGYADLMGSGEVEDMDERVKERARRIDEMGEKAREIADLFDRDAASVEAVALDELTATCVESVASAFPEVAIDCGPIPDDVLVDEALRPVVSNVVENAAEHNDNDDPRVRVRAETHDSRVRVVVADNGPGITEYEWSVLERGAETPLEHGSGLGLWLIQWGVGMVGGTVTYEQNDPTGSVVTVDVPVLSSDEPHRQNPDTATT